MRFSADVRQIWPVGVILLCGLSVHGADWCAWRGPQGNGTTDEGDWDPTTLKHGLKVRWRADIGRGHGAVAVRGARVYAFGNLERAGRRQSRRHDVVWCLDARTGKVVWEHSYYSFAPTNPDAMSYPWGGPRSTPVVDGDRVYTISQSGRLHCLAAAAGRVVWEKRLQEDLGISKPTEYGFCSSPVFHGTRLLLSACESGVALDKKTGDVIWASDKSKGCSCATPVLFQQDGRTLAVIRGEMNHYGVDPEDGSVLWSHRGGTGDMCSHDPVVYEGAVLISRFIGCALLDARTGFRRWNSREVSGSFAGSVVHRGFVYGFTRDSDQLQCFELLTGQPKWRVDATRGSLCLAGDKLVIVTREGRLVIAQADPEAYEEISSADVFDMSAAERAKGPNHRAWNCWTIPVLANGHLYVRNTQGDLACVALSAARTDSPAFRMWTDSTGRHQVEAEFVSRTGDTVKLRRKDTGQEVSLRSDQLSEEDRHWIDGRAERP